MAPDHEHEPEPEGPKRVRGASRSHVEALPSGLYTRELMSYPVGAGRVILKIALTARP